MKLSIIICTRNRAHVLADCLESLAASLANAALKDAEIVVVDNASTDDTQAIVAAWAAAAPVAVRLVYEARKGLSAARNCGVRASRGELVVFTDDDCRLSPTYVAELLRYDASDKELVMRSGSVLPGDPGDLPLTIKPVTAARRWQRPMELKDEGTILGGSLIGCNMAMRRAVLDRLGPFDEKLGAGTPCQAGEDSDYFYRAYLAGVALEIVPDLVVAHYHGRKQISDRTKLLKNYALGNAALSIKYLFTYPNFSRHLVWETKSCISWLFAPKDEGAPWLSAQDRMKYMLLGACIYVFLCVKEKLRGHGEPTRPGKRLQPYSGRKI